MSSYKKLTKEYEKELKNLREECKHEKLTNWFKYIGKIAYLHDQIIEITYCKECRMERRRRTKCPQCDSYIDKESWIRVLVTETNTGRFFEGIAIKGYMLFCNNGKCTGNYIERVKRKYEVKMEVPYKKSIL